MLLISVLGNGTANSRDWLASLSSMPGKFQANVSKNKGQTASEEWYWRLSSGTTYMHTYVHIYRHKYTHIYTYQNKGKTFHIMQVITSLSEILTTYFLLVCVYRVLGEPKYEITLWTGEKAVWGLQAQPLRTKKAEKLRKKRACWTIVLCEISLGLSKVEKFPGPQSDFKCHLEHHLAGSPSIAFYH